VAQHVRVNGERHLGQFASSEDHFEEPGPSHRPTAFGVEDEAALQVGALQLPKGPDLLAGVSSVAARKRPPTLMITK
jgi:hypothetical protein